jgi:peroxiredoxin Q/BCP
MEIKEGSKAPAFKGIDQNGNYVSFLISKARKLYYTSILKTILPGCTAQACNLRDNYHDLINNGFEVIGISTDSVKSHKKFEEKFDLPFPLIAMRTGR